MRANSPRLSDEQLEIAAERGLDHARIRCERTEKGALRMYGPPPQQIWLMIHIFHRELVKSLGMPKAPGHAAMRRWFFLRDNSVLCPDVAYIASGIDKRPDRTQSTTVLKLCPPQDVRDTGQKSRTPRTMAYIRVLICLGERLGGDKRPTLQSCLNAGNPDLARGS